MFRRFAVAARATVAAALAVTALSAGTVVASADPPVSHDSGANTATSLSDPWD